MNAVRSGVLAAMNGSPTLVGISGFGCAGNLAYAFADVSAQGNENSITVLLMQQDGTWTPASRATYCPDHQVPASIYVKACETN